jgi:hypothetical protein
MIEIENEDDVPVVLTEDEVRGSVTGHHVRYVLAFGLAGSIIAFVVIGLWSSSISSGMKFVRIAHH